MQVVRTLCLAAVATLVMAGCAKKEDPRQRPGFVDTSDPSKVAGTMTPPPKGGGGGGPQAGAKKP